MRIGVVADTHVPDRVEQLNPQVLDLLAAREVDVILHAGDVSSPVVLKELSALAPVHAVLGNRDIFLLRELPIAKEMVFNDVRVGMTHGHVNWWYYMCDRFHFARRGYYHDRLLPRIKALLPGANVIVFGHGHLPLNEWRGGQLYFNPGSPHFPGKSGLSPSIGILEIHSLENIEAKILYL